MDEDFWDKLNALEFEHKRLAKLCDHYAEFIAERGLWKEWSAYCAEPETQEVEQLRAEIEQLKALLVKISPNQ